MAASPAQTRADCMTVEELGKDIRSAALSLFPEPEFQYSKVYVLLLHWKIGTLLDEHINSLRHVFRHDYGFETERFLIPEEGSHVHLNRKILDFIEAGGDDPNHLKVVYYGGYGMLNENGQAVWSNLPDIKDRDWREVKWTGIQTALEMASSDVLLLLDCYCASTPRIRRSKFAMEMIAAQTLPRPPRESGDWSLTRSLVQQLRALRTQIKDGKIRQFAAGTLHSEILWRHQSTQLIPEIHAGPVHVILAHDPDFPRAIRLRPTANVTKDLALQTEASGPSKLNNPTPSPAPDAIGEIPLLRLEVFVSEKLQHHQLSADLFDRWLKDIPPIAGKVKVEAIFHQLSLTLLILSLPAPLRAYLPKSKTFISREFVESRNLLLPHVDADDFTRRETSAPADTWKRNNETTKQSPEEEERYQEMEKGRDRPAGDHGILAPASEEELHSAPQDNVPHQPSATADMTPWDAMDERLEMDDEKVQLVRYYARYYADLNQDDQSDLTFSDIESDDLRNFTILAPHSNADELRLLSRAYYYLFLRTRAVDDLQKSIEKTEEALEATPVDDTENADNTKYALLLKDLIVLLRKKYESTGLLGDLGQAISKAEIMLTITREFDMMRISRLVGLVDLKWNRYHHTGTPDDLTDAQVTTIDAASAIDVLEKMILRISDEAGHLRRQFDQTGDLAVLEEAVSKGNQAVASTPPDHPARAARLTNLVTSILRKFEHKSSIAVLNEALRRAQEAVDASPPSHPDRAWTLGNLGICLRLRFEQMGDLDDIHMAISAGQESVNIVPHGERARASMLGDLSVSLWRRFERIGDLDDLDQSIRHGKEAVTLMDPKDQYRSSALANLSLSLMRRFERTGNLDDLNGAINGAGEADAAMVDGHTDKGLALGNLCGCLRHRFDRTGDMADLNRAIDRGEKSVVVTHDGHFDKAARLSNLSLCYARRFERTNILDDLNQAIEKGRAVVRISRTPGGQHEKFKAPALNNLGVFLKLRFKKICDPADLNEATDLLEEAVTITPDDHPDKAARLFNLSGSYLQKYQSTRDLDDVNHAIDWGERAAIAIPDDHPTRSATLTTLASCLSARFGHAGEQHDLDRAIRNAEEATDVASAPPRDRIKAALVATHLVASFVRDWERISNLTATAVQLLPSVSPRALAQDDQQHMLGEFAGLASIAALAALEAGKGACQAVELLELGRGVIMSLKFRTRTELTDLRDAYPEIAARFETLRDELDPPHLPYSLPSPPPQRSRHEAARELDRILDKIRLLPKFETFGKPLSESELRDAARRGPLAIINVSENRCHALLVKPDGLRAVPLPLLKLADIKKRVQGPVSPGMLDWLWESTARPVLDELGFHDTPTAGNFPRMWWIPTGLMSRLPLHAASRQGSISSETVLDRVVSSYSASIKALAYARQNTMQKDLITDAAHAALLVSMRKTPETSDLMCAEQEVEVLDRILPLPMPRETLKQPRKEDVVASLETCTIFHFAGHGRVDPRDPSKSCLLLEDWENNPLTVENLAALKLHEKSPWLSYLSACSTGESKAAQLQDETIHLMSACQLAGFPHVVGSLWEIDDEYSVHMARETYKFITKTGWNSEAVALSVHKAVRSLQSETRGINWGAGYAIRDEGNPCIWAAYIHVGP